MYEQDKREASRYTCVIDGCDTEVIGLDDGWRCETRDGLVCADCWDHHREHSRFPDEPSARERAMTDGGQPEAATDRCPGCGEPGKKLDGDDWQDQDAYVCNENPCGVVMYGDGQMPGYGGI